MMNTVFSKAFFFLLLVVGGSVNLASYGGLSSSLRLGPVGALASTAPKDMPLSDLPEEFWFNDVSGESQWEDPTVEYKDDEGNTYWVDPELGESVWTKPAAAAWEATESTDPDHNGQTYYYNTVTHESQWEKPKELAWRKVKTADSHGAEL